MAFRNSKRLRQISVWFPVSVFKVNADIGPSGSQFYAAKCHFSH